MSKNRFLFCIAFWTLILLLAASPAGAIPGFFLSMGVMMLAIPVLAANRNAAAEGAAGLPDYMMLMPSLMIVGSLAIVGLVFFGRGLAAYQSGDAGQSRSLTAYGYQFVAISGALTLCVYSLGQNW